MLLPSAPKLIPLKTDPSARCRAESLDGTSAVKRGNPEEDMAFGRSGKDSIIVDYVDYESSSFSPEVVLGRTGRGEGYMRQKNFQDSPRG